MSAAARPEGHVYPVYDLDADTDHVVEGRSCWCRPKVQQVCPICDGAADGVCGTCSNPDCDDGWVPAYTDDPACPTVVVHHDVALASVN